MGHLIAVQKLNKIGEPHCEDGPALIYNDGSKVWLVNGKLHRTDGPAFMSPDGYCAWWVNDCRMVSNSQFKSCAGLTDEQMLGIILKYGDVG